MLCASEHYPIVRLERLIETKVKSGHDSFISCILNLEHRAPFGVSVITHTIRHTVGLLWTSYQPFAEVSTYTGQHNVQTQDTNIHAPRGIRTRDSSNQAAADLCLRPRGHWDWLTSGR
jgi:hypothetical protein